MAGATMRHMADDGAERVVKGGQELTARAWALIDTVGEELGLKLEVVQGGFKAGSGAKASGSTHDTGDVFDIRSRTLPDDRLIEVVVAFRRRNVCMWLRDPAHGWSRTGPHLHGVLRDSVHGLSTGAAWQVADYDRGNNGLTGSSHGRDPFPRPEQMAFPLEDDVALTDADIERIAQRTADLVWNRVIRTGFQSDGTFDAEHPQKLPARGLLAAAYGKSVQAADRLGIPSSADEGTLGNDLEPFELLPDDQPIE